MNEDRATRYQRQKRWAELLSIAGPASALAGLVATGGAVGLRLACEGMAGRILPGATAPLTFVLYVVTLVMTLQMAALPARCFGRLVIEGRYGVSQQTLGSWAIEEAKSLAIVLPLGLAGAAMLSMLLRVSPNGWWLPAGLLFGAVAVLVAAIGPALLPRLTRLKPIDSVPIRQRLIALAKRAGTRVLDVYVWESGGTDRARAALAGLGSTRRLLVSDTLLTDYSADEVDVVLAHELAHHVYGDVWKALALHAAAALAGFALSAHLLDLWGGALGLRDHADEAALPLIVLASGTVSLAMRPLLLAVSRANERRADRFALELTGNADAFISTVRRFAAQYLAEERPSTLVTWLFHSHPPASDRIVAARAFRGGARPVFVTGRVESLSGSGRTGR